MTRYQGHPDNVGLDALRRELLNQDQKKAQRPADRPRPALARRPLTPEEQAKVAELAKAGLLITAEEHKGHKRWGGNEHGILDHLPGRR
jgi:hypothetical protein